MELVELERFRLSVMLPCDILPRNQIYGSPVIGSQGIILLSSSKYACHIVTSLSSSDTASSKNLETSSDTAPDRTRLTVCVVKSFDCFKLLIDLTFPDTKEYPLNDIFLP